MNNSFFGKVMENKRKYANLTLVNNVKYLKKLIAEQNLDHLIAFEEILVAVHMKKTEIYFNKPIYLGMCILDLRKTDVWLSLQLHERKIYN